MKTPTLIVPESIYNSLSEKNPEVFKEEDFYHLFGVYLQKEDTTEETLVVTNIFTDNGIERAYAHASTFNVRDRLQIINNGLTVVARTLGLIGATVGNWHTHPDYIVGPSETDKECYRDSAKESGLGFFIGAVASRDSNIKTLRWFLYVLFDNSLTELKEDSGLVRKKDSEIFSEKPEIEKLMRIDVGDFVENLNNKAMELKTFPTPPMLKEGGHNFCGLSPQGFLKDLRKRVLRPETTI